VTQFNLLPEIYVYRFKVGSQTVHDATQPFVRILGGTYNVLCVGSNFTFEMAKHLYSVTSKLRKSDCEDEVDAFLQAFPRYPIDLFFFYWFDFGFGTLLHWACSFEREKIVSLLLSKNAALAINEHNNKSPLEIATRTGNQKIRSILLKVNWPKTHKVLPTPIQNSIEETLYCVSKIYNIPKELNIKIINTMLIKVIKWEE